MEWGKTGKISLLWRIQVKNICDFLNKNEKFQEAFCQIYKIDEQILKKILEKQDEQKLLEYVYPSTVSTELGPITTILKFLEKQEPFCFYILNYNDHENFFEISKYKINYKNFNEQELNEIYKWVLEQKWNEIDDIVSDIENKDKDLANKVKDVLSTTIKLSEIANNPSLCLSPLRAMQKCYQCDVFVRAKDKSKLTCKPQIPPNIQVLIERKEKLLEELRKINQILRK